MKGKRVLILLVAVIFCVLVVVFLVMKRLDIFLYCDKEFRGDEKNVILEICFINREFITRIKMIFFYYMIFVIIMCYRDSRILLGFIVFEIGFVGRSLIEVLYFYCIVLLKFFSVVIVFMYDFISDSVI